VDPPVSIEDRVRADLVGLLYEQIPLSSAISALGVEPLRTAKEPDQTYVAAHVYRLLELTAMRRIADLKSRLQRTNPVEQTADYNRMFGELVALEQHRRSMRELAVGAT